MARTRRQRHRHRRPATSRKRWRVVLVAVLGALIAFAGIGAGAAAWTVNHYGSNVTRVADVFPSGDRPAAATAASNQDPPLTFVLVGVDRQSGSAPNAEAVSLVRVTGDRQQVELVSLPTTTWTAPTGSPGTTLEQAYGTGDRQRLVGAVEGLTGIRADHYAEIDFAGFASMTQALGGINVDVPAAYANRGRTFSPGRQHLDGPAALAYLRSADSQEAHEGAAQREQAVVAGLFRAASAKGLSDVGALTSTLQAVTDSLSVDDSLSNTDLLRLASSLRGVGQPAFVSAPMAGRGTEGGTAVQYLDPDRSRALWGYLADDSLGEHLDEFR